MWHSFLLRVKTIENERPNLYGYFLSLACALNGGAEQLRETCPDGLVRTDSSRLRSLRKVGSVASGAKAVLS